MQLEFEANDPEPAGWEWLVRGRYLGFTLTFTHAVTPGELLRRYGLDPGAARLVPFAGIDAALRPGPAEAVVRAGTLNGWAFAIEIPGSRGSASATLADLSEGTRTIAVHFGANAFHLLSYWENGQPREQFEPGAPATLRATGPHHFWDATERHRTARPDATDVLSALRAVGDHVGAHLPPELDDGPLPSLLLPQTVPPRPSPVPPPPLVRPTAPRPRGRLLGSFRPSDLATGAGPGHAEASSGGVG
ncbi:DUF6461 domain-containing protein [Actinacidiphila yeochonensis]|uniref:DUF6461 domain-containing protein n=1 Tax=Actinacidiphila yeochonensis TaxID=89050 RepID=UPI000B2E6518|nr:DUF6461 domain-containing protein [Actinacidiphila yeochonensis]